MPIHIASRRKKVETIKREFGDDCIIIDVTSKGEMPWLQFSPFYPIGGIPVPLSPGVTAQSVEGSGLPNVRLRCCFPALFQIPTLILQNCRGRPVPFPLE